MTCSLTLAVSRKVEEYKHPRVKRYKKYKKTYVGITPYSYQKAVIDELREARRTSKVVTVRSRRQTGKSMLVTNMLLYYAINMKGSKNACLSPTIKQAKKIYKELVDAIEKSGIIKSANATDLEIKLINGSTIFFRSAQQKENLRGYTVSGILCIDEAAFIDDEAFYLVLPWTDVWKSPVLITSTPFVKSGFYYQYYQYGKDGRKGYVTVDWTDDKYKEDLDKVLPPERLEEYRRILPKNQFKSEYMGEFLDDDGCVFTHFKECVKSGKISGQDRLFVGIDWANGVDNDDTVVSIINDKGQQVMLEYFNNLTPTQQIDRVVGLLKPLKNQIVVIQPELNSIGTPYTDLLEERLQLKNTGKVQGFNTSNKSKNDIVAKLQVAFENEEIGILDDEKQMRQLGTYAAEYNVKTKTVSYNAPSGLHDDICIALMLSWDAYKNNKSGVYCISVL